MQAVWRILLVIPTGFVAACYAASVVLVLSPGTHPAPGESAAAFAARVLLLSGLVLLFVGAVAAVPALIAIVLAEIFRWRSMILNILIGAGIGWAAFLADIGGRSEAHTDLAVGGGAGALAGLVYWLIAGRNAGIGEPLDDAAAAENDVRLPKP